MEKRKVIGVFSCEISEKIQLNFYEQLYKYAKKNGYTLLFFSASKDQDSMEGAYNENEYLINIAEKVDLAAIIIHAQAIVIKERIYQAIDIGLKKEVPVFVYDREAAGIDDVPGIYKLDLNYKQGFAAVVRHVIEVHDAKNIFMLAGIKDNSYSEDRIAMYRQEMEAHNLPYTEEHIGYGNFWEMPAREAVNTFLDCGLEKPDAIVCANDTMAITAIKVLEERGYKVPEDIIVTGFDGIEDSKFNVPSITTCGPDFDTVAAFVMDAIDKYNTDRVDTKEAFLIPIEVWPRESCGCSSENILNLRDDLIKLISGLRHDSWQNRIMNHLQMSLFDSVDFSSNIMYMGGVLDMFSGFAHFIAIREDIEENPDYYGDFSKMHVILCDKFNSQLELDLKYELTELFPGWDKELASCNEEEFFLVRLLHGSKKVYGYHLEKLNRMLENDIRLLDEFASCVTGIIENILRNKKLMRANERLQDMYRKDTMTGLYNRRGYAEKLEETLANNVKGFTRIHMFSIDMDGMKFINDNYGHSEGDNAIIAVAESIKAYFEDTSICSRFGGDEFIVVAFSDDSDEMDTKTIAKILNIMVSEHPLVKDKGYPIGVSVGHSYAPISENTNTSVLMKKSDAEMYEDKKNRKAGRKN